MDPISSFLLRLTFPHDQGGITQAQLLHFFHFIDQSTEQRMKKNVSVTSEQLVALYRLLSSNNNTEHNHPRITQKGLELFLSNPDQPDIQCENWKDKDKEPTAAQIARLLEMINPAIPLSPILLSDLEAFLKDPSMGQLEADLCELPTRKQIREAAARCQARMPTIVVHQRNFQAWLDTYHCRFSTGDEPKNTLSFEVDYSKSIGGIIRGRKIEWQLGFCHRDHNVFDPKGLHWYPGDSRPQIGTTPPEPSIQDFIGLWAKIKDNPVKEKYTVEADYIYFQREFSIEQIRDELCNRVQKYGWRPMTLFEVLSARSKVPIIAFASRCYDNRYFIQASDVSIGYVDPTCYPRPEKCIGIVRIGQNPVGDKEWESV